MATVRMWGQTFAVDLVQKLGLDSEGQQLWRAISRGHTARSYPGKVITIKQSHIMEAAAAEMPAEDSDLAALPSTPSSTVDTATTTGLGELEAAMAEERKTLPSPAELIAQYRTTIQPQAVSVPPGPTHPPARGGKSREFR